MSEGWTSRYLNLAMMKEFGAIFLPTQHMDAALYDRTPVYRAIHHSSHIEEPPVLVVLCGGKDTHEISLSSEQAILLGKRLVHWGKTGELTP